MKASAVVWRLWCGCGREIQMRHTGTKRDIGWPRASETPSVALPLLFFWVLDHVHVFASHFTPCS